MKQNGDALEYVSEGLRGDRQVDTEIAMEAVKQNGDALGYASEKLQRRGNARRFFEPSGGLAEASRGLSNREIAMEAVKQNGDALEYVSEELQRRGNARLFFLPLGGLAEASKGPKLTITKLIIL